MKYKFLSLIFMLFTITRSNASRRDALHHQRFSSQTIKDKIGYMKPIDLGPYLQLNITSLLSRLKIAPKGNNHRLTGFDPETEDSKMPEKRIEINNKEDLLRDLDHDGPDASDDSRDDEPMMRAGQRMEEGDLRYDFDEDDLRVSLK